MLLAEGPDRVASHDMRRSMARHRGTTRQVQNGPELTDIVTRPDRASISTTTVGQLPVHLEQARLHVVDQLSPLTLAEEELPAVRWTSSGSLSASEKFGASSITRSASWLTRSSCVETTTMRPGAGQFPHEAKNALDLDVIEVGGGLVGQQQRRIVDEGTGDRHALLLPSGQLGGAMMGSLVKPDAGQQFVGPRLGRPPGCARQPHRNDDIATGTEAGDQVEGLEYHAHRVAAVLGQRRAAQLVDDDGAELAPSRWSASATRRDTRAGSSCRSPTARAEPPARRPGP